MAVCTVSQGKGASVCRGLGLKERFKYWRDEKQNWRFTETLPLNCSNPYSDRQPKLGTVQPCFLGYIFWRFKCKRGNRNVEIIHILLYHKPPPNVFPLSVTCQTRLWHLTADKMMGRGAIGEQGSDWQLPVSLLKPNISFFFSFSS